MSFRSSRAPFLGMLALAACADAGPWNFDLTPIPPIDAIDASSHDASTESDGQVGDGATQSDGGTPITGGSELVPPASCTSTGSDVPDDAFVDADCDGLDGDSTHTVFVATTGSDDNASMDRGTPLKPFRTIGAGIAAAAARADGSVVAVSKGIYQEHVTLVSGVSVYGGYDSANHWQRSETNTTTIRQDTTNVFSGPQGFAYIEGVLAPSIAALTVLDRFNVSVGDPSSVPSLPGVSIYGIRVLASSAGLDLRNLTVTAGRGSNGADAAVGADGEKGSDGGGGSFPGTGAAGQGGVATCGPDGVVALTRGGNGGLGGNDSAGGCGGNNAGADGDPPARDGTCLGGPGGGAGAGCLSIPYQPGGAGGVGRSDCAPDSQYYIANAASPISNAAAVTGGFLVSRAGNPGARGFHAVGGSGGGGSGTDTVAIGSGDGASGGGGGSGGCGGYGGNGGQAGGSSVGLLVIDSADVLVTASHFTSSAGGNGGRGAAGGFGGMGGIGGPASKTNWDATHTYSGAGGSGRRGGRGGPGGGGAGGSSLAQVTCNSTNVSGIDDSTGTAGAGGTAGLGATSGSVAPAGLAGKSIVTAVGCSF